MVYSIYSLVCFPYMCAKACFRDLLRSLCLQDLGLGWKKKLTVTNVWFKLTHRRPHGRSLIRVNSHFPSFAREAVKTLWDQIPCPLSSATSSSHWDWESAVVYLHPSSWAAMDVWCLLQVSDTGRFQPEGSLWGLSSALGLSSEILALHQNAPFPLKSW